MRWDERSKTDGAGARCGLLLLHSLPVLFHSGSGTARGVAAPQCSAMHIENSSVKAAGDGGVVACLAARHAVPCRAGSGVKEPEELRLLCGTLLTILCRLTMWMTASYEGGIRSKLSRQWNIKSFVKWTRISWVDFPRMLVQIQRPHFHEQVAALHLMFPTAVLT